MDPNRNRPNVTGSNTARGQAPCSPATPTLPLLPFTRQEADQGHNNNDNITPDELREVFLNPAFRGFFVREFNSLPDEPEQQQNPTRTPTGSQTPPTRPATPSHPGSQDLSQIPATPPREGHRPHILPRHNLCRQHSCSGRSVQNREPHLSSGDNTSDDEEFPCSQRLEQRNHNHKDRQPPQQ